MTENFNVRFIYLDLVKKYGIIPFTRDYVVEGFSQENYYFGKENTWKPLTIIHSSIL